MSRNERRNVVGLAGSRKATKSEETRTKEPMERCASVCARGGSVIESVKERWEKKKEEAVERRMKERMKTE